MTVLAEKFLKYDCFPMTDYPRPPKEGMAADLLPNVSDTPHAMTLLTMLLERIYRYDSVVKALLVGTGYSG